MITKYRDELGNAGRARPLGDVRYTEFELVSKVGYLPYLGYGSVSALPDIVISNPRKSLF
jgi:hypothetical protein